MHVKAMNQLVRAVPNRAMSRAMGGLSSMSVPEALRQPLFSTWMAAVGVDASEMAEPDLTTYRTLDELFTRRLRPEARPVDADPTALVSPADGRIVSLGRVRSRAVEQVKGATYDLLAFLGEPEQDVDYTVRRLLPAAEGASARPNVDEADKTALYQCVVYLSPKDYHRFHAPADMVVRRVRHFAGELLSVNPGLTRALHNLFVFNERVVLLGQWAYGFLGYAAVGATNVGSISLVLDQTLRTNQRSAVDADVALTAANSNVVIPRGGEVGAFHLGSTIVLLFEAPLSFGFAVREGQTVRMGQALGWCSRPGEVPMTTQS